MHYLHLLNLLRMFFGFLTVWLLEYYPFVRCNQPILAQKLLACQIVHTVHECSWFAIGLCHAPFRYFFLELPLSNVFSIFLNACVRVHASHLKHNLDFAIDLKNLSFVLYIVYYREEVVSLVVDHPDRNHFWYWPIVLSASTLILHFNIFVKTL